MRIGTFYSEKHDITLGFKDGMEYGVEWDSDSSTWTLECKLCEVVMTHCRTLEESGRLMSEGIASTYECYVLCDKGELDESAFDLRERLLSFLEMYSDTVILLKKWCDIYDN